MAKGKKKSQKKRMAKIIPTELSLKYNLAGSGTDEYVDIARDLSRVNRRGYNQGFVYGVQSITIRQNTLPLNSNFSAHIAIKTPPITWVAVQAYMKGRNAWLRQQREVRQSSGQVGIKPAYEDFKIYLDGGMRAGSIIPTRDGAGNNVASGEWDYSQLVYADQSVDPEVVKGVYLHLVGPDTGASPNDIGLVNAYEDSRSTVQPTDPNVPAAASTNIYALLTAGQDEAASQTIINKMEDENDQPPYDVANYAGGAVNYPGPVDKVYLQTSAANPIVHSPSFGLLAGMMRIYSQGKDLTTGNDFTVPMTMIVHLAPGNYKGVGAVPVGDLS